MPQCASAISGHISTEKAHARTCRSASMAAIKRSRWEVPVGGGHSALATRNSAPSVGACSGGPLDQCQLQTQADHGLYGKTSR